MKCQGKFKFKGLVKKSGGSFKNNQGKEILYDESYSLSVDETTDKGIYTRTFKVRKDSELVDKLLLIKPYTDIVIEFDINFYRNIVSIVPVALIEK